MSSLSQLAQVAQLAGSKRKSAHDTDFDSLATPQQSQLQLPYSNSQPWPPSWSYPQSSFQVTARNPQYQSNNALSNLEHLPTKPDAFHDPSVSPPSTDYSSRNWYDTASTSNTSYASSPIPDGPLNATNLSQSMSFVPHQYSNAYAGFPNNSLFYPSYNRSANLYRATAGKIRRADPGLGQQSFHHGNAILAPHCVDDAMCNDPTCSDGIPCDGEQLPACDKDDCDDAIPCPSVFPGPFMQSSATSYPEPPTWRSTDCSVTSSGDAFCCSDKCPQETRCPSPCFEQDCDVPPCDIDHIVATPWDWSHGSGLTGSMNACVDPRHTFQDPKSFDCEHMSWANRLHDPLCYEARNGYGITDGELFTSKDWAAPLPKTHSHDHHQPSDKQAANESKPVHVHSHRTCCSATKPRHLHQSKRPVRSNRHICQWVLHGDSNGADAEVCGHESLTPKELQLHVVTHIEGLEREEGLFPCRWKGCNHRFSDGFSARPKLKRHLMVHTGSAPYKCDEPGCDVAMKTKDALDKHKRTHTGAKPYICTFDGCQSRFATSTELKTHLIVHSGMKPHKCPRCGDCFADSSNLSKHKKVHEVPKFKCPDCEYKMKRWDQMRRHFKSQKHALYIVQSKTAEAEYKKQMQEAFDKLTPEERILPLSREGSTVSKIPEHLENMTPRLEKSEPL